MTVFPLIVTSLIVPEVLVRVPEVLVTVLAVLVRLPTRIPSPMAYATVRPSMVLREARTWTPLSRLLALILGCPTPSMVSGLPAGTTTSSA